MSKARMPADDIPKNRIIVTPNFDQPSTGTLAFGGKTYLCALGKAGVTTEKREGDHMTPVGSFALREVLFRPDKFAEIPATMLYSRAIRPTDGWCDASGDPMYNQPVKLPYPASAENLWRDDEVYDLIVPLGYNDHPPRPGKGSAIFLHIARPDFSGTEGCVALARADLIEVLETVGVTTQLTVVAPEKPKFRTGKR